MNRPSRDANTRYELYFEPLLGDGPGLCFPCDEHGHVDFDVLGDDERNTYLYARVLRGHLLAAPVIRRACSC